LIEAEIIEMDTPLLTVTDPVTAVTDAVTVSEKVCIDAKHPANPHES